MAVMKATFKLVVTGVTETATPLAFNRLGVTVIFVKRAFQLIVKGVPAGPPVTVMVEGENAAFKAVWRDAAVSL